MPASSVFTSSPVLWILSESLVILGITAAPSRYYQRAWFLLILAFNLYQLFYTAVELDPREYIAEYGLGCRLSVSLFFASYYLLLKDAPREVHLIGHNKGNIADAPLKSRLWWAAHLTYNLRAVSWSHEPAAYLPPRPKQQTRRAFIVSQLAFIVLCAVVYDATNTIAKMSPYFDKSVDPAEVMGYARLWRLTSVCYLMLIYLALSMEYTALSIIWVGTGLSKPQDWPRLFGSPLDAYTLRRFWGKTWHQMLRGMFGAHVDFLANALHLPPKSKLTTYFKLHMTFFISGLMHHLADYVILHSFTWPTSIKVFVLHAVAITFEDGFLALARRAGFRETWWTRVLGYAWVIVWFAYSLPFWIDPVIPLGFLDGYGLIYPWVLRTVFAKS